jgi:biotin carboxylase
VKKALILGVGAAQADAIRHLKDTGWWVIGCSHRREGPGLGHLDRFELVDIIDVASIVAKGRDFGIDLIYSVGSDLAMPSVATAARELGLPSFVSTETAALLHDKVCMRRLLADHGLSPVAYRAVRNDGDLGTWDVFPAMIKPTDSQGQRGVMFAKTPKELQTGLQTALQFSASQTAVVEEFLEGPEISVNAFVSNGELVCSFVSDRVVLERYPGGIPLGHVLPSRHCTGSLLTETRALVAQCLMALGIRNGPVYFQLKLTSRGPKVVEITPRLDGCHLWRLIRTVYGVDLMKTSFDWLSGQALGPFNQRDVGATADLVFFMAPPGQRFHASAHSIPEDAIHAEYYYQNGQVVAPVNGHMEKVGFFIREHCHEDRGYGGFRDDRQGHHLPPGQS